ncbi:MAG TPA: GWxTD domain-containing protein [Terriglobia bacterium]|nr:GWxTD domain-containing protein [Terriglobia bacterium]
MSRRGIFVTLTSLCLLTSSFSIAQKKNDPKKIEDTKKEEQKKKEAATKKSREQEAGSRALRKWLDEDVSYIITNEERAAFKALKTDEEREQFIEQFWLRRDPTPDTIDNEYKEDHYERIAYANERFASGIPGWKTDRGRIYILYGKPDEIESHPSGGTYDRPIEEGGGTTSTFPFEIWRYRYIEGIGNEVLLEFVDPSMSGEYRMTIDPSEKDALLHVPGAGLTFDEQFLGIDKSQRLTNANGASLGNALGNTSRNNPFDRLQLMANIFKPPEIKFKDLEAIVTTKLSYNLLPFRFRTDFVRVTEDSVLTPITILMQNKDLAFQEQEGIHRAVVNVFGKITGITGRVAPGGIFEDTISQDIPDALFKQQLDGGSIHQKVIPLRPGLYKLDLVLKDIHSGNVGTVSQRLQVPRFPEDKLQLSSLILADVVENLPPSQVGSGSFILGANKVRPNVNDDFRKDKNLNLWFQVYNLKLDEATRKPSATVEMLITKNGREVKREIEQASELSNAAAQMTLSKNVPLKDFEPGEYSVQVKVTDNLTKDVIASAEKFTVR